MTKLPEADESTAVFVVFLRRDRFRKGVKFSGNIGESGGAFAVLVRRDYNT